MLFTKTKRLSCAKLSSSERGGITTNEYYWLYLQSVSHRLPVHSASQARLPEALAMVKACHMTSSQSSHVCI